MEFIIHIVEHALEDTVALIPFLFITYLALEALEHAAGTRVNDAVRRAGAAGPAVGALLGVVPQCGFSAMAATLYAGRVVTLGTLVAVFLSTSDEMLPMLVAERVALPELARILGLKVVLALATGMLADFAVRALRRNAAVHDALRRSVLGVHRDGVDTDVVDQMAEGGEGADHIHRLCEHDRCGCGHAHAHGRGDGAAHGHAHGRDGGYGEGCDHAHGGAPEEGPSSGGAVALSVVRSALSHTIQVTAFILLVSMAFVAVLETVGEGALEAFLSGNPLFAVFASALVGLVPNCSASVVITQLYLEGVLGFAPLMAGLLTSAGVGYLVLFRTNRHPRENVVIVALIFAAACLWGIALGALGL